MFGAALDFDGYVSGMGGHVPAISDERERAEHRAVDDLADHHDGGQAYNRPDALRIPVVARAQKHMLVLE